MHLKPYPVELVTVKVSDYDCMHSEINTLKKLIKNLAVCVIHTISYRYDRAFWCRIVLQFDEQ